MAAGSGLEIRYSLGSGAQRRVVYSPQRLVLLTAIFFSALATVGAAHWGPNLAGQWRTLLVKAIQAATENLRPILLSETAEERLEAKAPNRIDSATPILQPTAIEPPTTPLTHPARDVATGAPALRQVKGNPVATKDSNTRESVDKHLVDFTPLRMWKTTPNEASTHDGPRSLWNLRIGLHNRALEPLRGAVAIAYRGQTSPAIPFKMTRYVEKELVIPGLQVQTEDTEIMNPKLILEILRGTLLQVTGPDGQPLDTFELSAAVAGPHPKPSLPINPARITP